MERRATALAPCGDLLRALKCERPPEQNALADNARFQNGGPLLRSEILACSLDARRIANQWLADASHSEQQSPETIGSRRSPIGPEYLIDCPLPFARGPRPYLSQLRFNLVNEAQPGGRRPPVRVSAYQWLHFPPKPSPMLAQKAIRIARDDRPSNEARSVRANERAETIESRLGYSVEFSGAFEAIEVDAPPVHRPRVGLRGVQRPHNSAGGLRAIAVRLDRAADLAPEQWQAMHRELTPLRELPPLFHDGLEVAV